MSASSVSSKSIRIPSVTELCSYGTVGMIIVVPKMIRTVLVVLTLGCVFLVDGYIIEPGPLVHATNGEVWPEPQERIVLDYIFLVRPSRFKFQALGQNCDILEDAFERYWGILQRFYRQKINNNKNRRFRSMKYDIKFGGDLPSLGVYLQLPCSSEDFPTFDMDEKYTLNITEDVTPNALLTSKSIWGILRGLETFVQLVHMVNNVLIINATNIHDYPRFPHRGLLLDTSRHFLPVPTILQTLDAMSYNKMNVFHWHVTDDQSFPFQSRRFPELSDMGAFHPYSAVYSPNDVKNIIRYATFRGIRVLPEFDTPGHTRSWGVAVPELLTQCFYNGTFRGIYGPMDPSRNFTFSFINDLFTEVTEAFPDKFLHLGGDEVDFDCWETNADVKSFMDELNISGNYAALESYFLQQLFEIADNLNRTAIIWEDMFENGVEINSNDTVVQVWKTDYIEMMEKVTAAGKRALLSSCWYLDHLSTGGDWRKFYECDPLDFPSTEDQRRLVEGGEACMWGESVNEFNVLQRVWPRASAAAEVLWSAANASTIDYAARRLEEHTCRMNGRGIPAQPPNGPGYCF